MIKHVGKHGDKKIVLLFREVPNENHMCLLVYSDLLPRLYHDEIMRLVESGAGQESKSFSDLLHRSTFSDGNNCLLTLHKSGFIKKVRTDQVRMTPNSRSSVSLNELNTILKSMESGKEAEKQMAEIERGTKKSKQEVIREVGMPVPELSTSVSDGVLSDSDLARDRINQATRMRADAARLLAEADTLMAEAIQLDPTLNDKPKPAKKKAATKSKKD